MLQGDVGVYDCDTDTSAAAASSPSVAAGAEDAAGEGGGGGGGGGGGSAAAVGTEAQSNGGGSSSDERRARQLSACYARFASTCEQQLVLWRCEKRPVVRHLILKTIILPRQARDGDRK